MRVSRSLTIKQMAMVAVVSMFFVLIFCVILLFHFLQQNRYNTATQLESIARSVREPLSAAILKADIPEAEAIIKQIKPAGVVSRADVMLPNQFQALRMRFIPERPVPVTITRMFELPIQISLPIYSLERPVNPQPLAYLVLQADSYRVYKFVISTLSTLVTAYLLLTLMLTVALTWCINRLVMHPLRKIARELDEIPPQALPGHQLPLPRHHKDDEIGRIVRSYNRNQQQLQHQQEESHTQTVRFPVSELPNKAVLLALLEQAVTADARAALLIISSDTLRDTAGVLHEDQREVLLLTLVEKLKSVLSPGMLLAQLNISDFALFAPAIQQPWQAMKLSKQVLTVINERVPLKGIQLRPHANLGVAMTGSTHSAQALMQQATSALAAAQRNGKNQIHFFDAQQREAAHSWLSQEADLLSALEQQRFALWLQPLRAQPDSEVVSARALLRLRKSDDNEVADAELFAQIEACGLTGKVCDWMLEEACHLLADWQARGITLPLAVALPAEALLQQANVAGVAERLRHYDLPPQSLRLDICERQLFSAKDEAVSPDAFEKRYLAAAGVD